MPTRYIRRPEPKNDHYGASPLPVDRPAAIYYRQSTDAQIGNINTTLQTVDMFEHLVRQGWSPDAILMIDMDAGVSGSKKISERPGMSHLVDLIESGQISLVAAQDVDRFFRDVTQIQVNIFIDACKRNRVCVLTPRMLYDFNHPTMGAYHMKIFRDEAQHAADFLEYHIKGRLHASRAHLHEQGKWAGRQIIVGYMVDLRPKLPDGTPNPLHRSYVPFRPAADVIRTYFELFKRFNRNLIKTYNHIEQYGPFFPDNMNELVPEGFKIDQRTRYRSRHSGRVIPSLTGFGKMLTNVVYVGHWVHREAIIRFYNHEAIVDEDLFMYAFNALSPNDFYGEPNPHYHPHRTYNRHARADRTEAPPVYGGLVFSDDLPDYPHRRLHIHWNSHNQVYQYSLRNLHRELRFSAKASRIDKTIDDLLLERLKATTVDETAWQTAIASTRKNGHAELRRVESDIRSAERAKAAILENLKMLQHPDMVRSLEASYAANQREIERLRSELAVLQQGDATQTLLEDVRPVLDSIIAHWGHVPATKRRALFEALADYANVTALDEVRRELTVRWRDGSQTSLIFRWGDYRQHWTQAELERLREMVEAARPQVEIMRAFPHWNWSSIAFHYAYHFTTDRRFTNHYRGEKKYPYRWSWSDTTEYQLEQAALNPLSTHTSPP
ncbi:MAG: recombinase family protein [Anaerolineae bacterium]|nr:recombinase family protein [Anaerolineae bacterium]